MDRMGKGAGKGSRIMGYLTVAACIFLSIGVMVLFHACEPKEDGTWMSCHYAQLTVFALGLVMTALSVAACVVQGRISRLLHLVTAIVAAAAAIIPGNVIHLCMMNEMRCRAVMRPSVILVSILIIVFSLVNVLMGAGEKRKQITHR